MRLVPEQLPTSALPSWADSSESFRLLVEAVSDYAIYMLDPSGNVTTWNAGAEKLKQYTAEEVLGTNFARFFPEDAVRAGKPAAELAKALSHGRFEEEALRLRKDGTSFWANVVLTPVRDKKGELLGFAKVTRDLSARIAAERTARELAQEQAARAAAEYAEARVREAAQIAEDAARRAEEANRVKDEFLATVSHELRTPLNAIVGWSALLRGRETDEKTAKGLDVIHRNALAQSKIIEDILDVSRIITGKLRLDVRTIDLAAIVNEAIEVVRPSAMSKELTLEFEPPTRSVLLAADPDRLQQVVWNLLSNAVKFSFQGGLVRIVITVEHGQCTLSVSDTGRGIEPMFLPFVFDRFKQADSSLTRRVGGLGLGLAIVRHLIELHGGQVHASSDGIGQGATFGVTLPLRAASVATSDTSPVEQPAEPPAAVAITRHALGETRVLVIDDDEDARHLLMTVLGDAGARVEIAASAAEGFAKFQRFRPHVLISDIGMPEEDGYSLIRRVRSVEASEGGCVPSIALTAYTRAQDKTKALAMGFTTHLGKPIDPHDLVAAVTNLAAFARR